jgi:4-diphosphocytidyl-2-C-methyl-D-erythritol kinase
LTELRETAFAKLNLALHVRDRMADGYHRIETQFAFCEDGDELSCNVAPELYLEISGPFAAELNGEEDNLVLRAARSLQREAKADNGAALRLNKVLPVGSGLGGGSADAAAALRLLNRLWGLNWSPDRLEPIARRLGADVPACLYSLPMMGKGRGDELQPIEDGLSGQPVLLVNPRASLATSTVFGQWDGVDRGPLHNWRNGRNDLEEPASQVVPLIRAILAWLSVQQGVQLVRMSGSGATCFALFESEDARDRSAEAVPREWWRLATQLR